jgi:RimJ/RimL family protein N-acetyltransferase
MKYFKKLVGENCYLSPICYDDVDKYTEWVNNMETGLNVLFASDVVDIHKERKLLEYLTGHDVMMAIVDIVSNEAIGICGLHNKNDVHRTATYGIFIGDRNNWGKALGTDATLLMLDYAFSVLNLNSISLEVIDFNQRAIKCYEKCGFRFIGRKRQAVFIAGIYHDSLLYDILASEFSSKFVNGLYNSVIKPTGKNKNLASS